MEEFVNWWKLAHPGLHCFLLSDNMKIHTNEAIVKTARKHGIHMLNIMPGTSHWFQVHDQLPFANLKKNLAREKIKCSRLFSHSPARRKALLMGVFYKAERKAFEPNIVKRSFADVGLWPWKPEKIWKICLKHTPVQSKDEDSEMMRDLIDAINIHKQRQETATSQILSGLKPASITDSEHYKFQIFRDDDDSDNMVDDDEQDASQSNAASEDMQCQPPAKRLRRPSGNHKTCDARGCQKSHVRSKKWVECPKCKRNFCPTPAEKLVHHKC